jgi:hypothetical protein
LENDHVEENNAEELVHVVTSYNDHMEENNAKENDAQAVM